MMDPKRLDMPLGEAMFTQRSIRKFKADPIPMEDIHLIIDAAVKAPNGGNRQVGRFLVLTDRKKIPRSSLEAHAAANLAIFDFVLSAEEMAEIFTLARPRGRLVNPGSAPNWDR